jgi:hypothetical protein
MRFRITVRGEHVELRGYFDVKVDDEATPADLAEAMRPFGIVMASVADDDYDPFLDWHH